MKFTLTLLFIVSILLRLIFVAHHLLEEEVPSVVLVHLQLHSGGLWTRNRLVEQFDQHGEVLREVWCERLGKLHVRIVA